MKRTFKYCQFLLAFFMLVPFAAMAQATSDSTTEYRSDKQAYYTRLKKTVCDVYNFYGNQINVSGTYTNVTQYNGKPNNITLELHVFYTAKTTEQYDVCDTFVWKYGKNLKATYTASGTYKQTIPNAVGGVCDSVKTVNLTVRKSSESHNTQTVCDSYTWPSNGTTYDESKEESFVIPNKQRCDSTLYLHLTVNQSSQKDLYENACNSYLWHGTTYTTSQSPIRHDRNSKGCDSTTILHLTIRYADRVEVEEDVCDLFEWNPHDRSYTSSTTDSITLANIAGCDSTVVLHVNIRHKTAAAINQTIVQNQLPYTFNGTTYSSVTNVEQQVITLTNAAHCDSVITYSLIIYPNVTATADSIVCYNLMPFRWNGRTFTSVGTQVVVLRAHTGADSTLTMNVTNHPSYETPTFGEVCDNEFYNFYGQRYNRSGNYRHRLATIHGCDSIISLTLTVRPTYNNRITQTICNNQSYTFNGQTFTTAGTFTETVPSVHQCDSMVTFTLNINDTSTSEVFDTIVQNRLPFNYYNLSFAAGEIGGTADTARIARYTNGNRRRCDSVITYHLYVHPNVFDTIDSAVCANKLPVRWNNRNYNATGLYDYTTRDIHGADSTTTLRLTVLTNPERTVNDTIVENALPIHVYDTVFNDAVRNVRFERPNPGACDSIIKYNLAIRWNTVTRIDTAVCADELPYTWHGHTYNEIGRFYDTVRASNGTDSVLAYNLNTRPLYHTQTTKKICENKTYTFGGNVYNTSGTYTDSLVTRFYGCDSLSTLNLTVNPVTFGELYDTIFENNLPRRYFSQRYYNNVEHEVVMTTNHYGCDSTIDYSLFVIYNRRDTAYQEICSTELPYTWNETEFRASDLRTNPPSGPITKTKNLRGGASTGADSVVVMVLTVHPAFSFEESHSTCESNMQAPYYWAAGDTTLDSGSVTGDYTRHFATNFYGCDSIHTLHLKVSTSSASYVYDTVVENAVRATGCYTYNGLQFCDTVTVTDTQLVINNAFGCDSTIHYNLFVRKNVRGLDTATLCFDQLPFTWNNATFLPTDIADHTVRDTIRREGTILAANGADSIVSMTLAVMPTYHFLRSDTICDDTVAFFMGDIYSAPGSDMRHLVSADGCDSAWTFTLTIFPTAETTLRDTIYEESFCYFGGMALNTTGTYRDSLRSMNGCDSICIMHLIVNHLTRLDSVICRNQVPFTWNNLLFYNSKKDSTHLRSSDNVDSLIIMTVTVNDTSATYDFQEHCDAYTWRDSISYTASTTEPKVMLQNRFNCDSVIHLSLIVNYSHPDTHYHHACNIFYWMNGENYDQSIVGPTHMLRTTHDCDSLVTLNLTVDYNTYNEEVDSLCSGYVYSWRGIHNFIEGGTYYDSLLTTRGCDSVTVLFLTELAAPSIEFDVQTSCTEFTHTITAKTNGNYLSWSSVPADPALEEQRHNATITVSPLAPTTYKLYTDYKRQAFCPSEDVQILSIIEQPTASMHSTPEYITQKDNKIAALDLSPVYRGRNWYINGYLTDNHTEHFSYTMEEVFDTVHLMLEVRTEYCRDTAHAYIPYYKPTLFVPSAFNPTQQDNKLFRAFGSEILEFEIFIYNSRGQMVFHSRDINEGWDGRYKGEMCSQGSYVYRIKYRDSIVDNAYQSLVGSVVLIR